MLKVIHAVGSVKERNSLSGCRAGHSFRKDRRTHRETVLTDDAAVVGIPLGFLDDVR